MQFREAKIVTAPRRPTGYLVEDNLGKFHGFMSAEEANKVFPGAFDVPDSDDDETENQ